MTHRRSSVFTCSALLTLIIQLWLLPTLARAGSPEHISLTWLSIANWLFEVGETRIVIDGYITRLPASTFSGPSFALGKPSVPDTAAIQRVIKALNISKVDYLFTGHSHFDHSFDTATWAKLTGAQIVGARSTCLQAVGQGIPESQCSAVEGGEVMTLSEDLSVRVVRWNHSGDVTTTEGRLLHAPLELLQAPTPVPDSGGLRPGILQDFPNGGGARAYVFTAQTTAGPVHWFYSNTGNTVTFSQPVKIDTVFFTEHELALDNLRIADHSTSARDHLQAALSAAGLDSVDLWLGFSDRPLAEAVYQVLKPKAHIPHHWDGLFTSFFDGVPYAYSAFPQAAGVAEFWQAQQVTFLPQKQYLDKYVLTTEGVRAVENGAVKLLLGFSDPS